jgi:hypothetical protein
MLKQIAVYLLSGLLLIAGVAPMVYAQQIPTYGNPSPLSHVGGTFYATAFSTYVGRVISGNTGTGSVSIVATAPPALADGTPVGIQNLWPATGTPLGAAFAPILVNDANAETVTPTAVSFAPCPAGNVGVGGSPLCATITGTFNNTHGQGAAVQSGTFGLQEAINAAQLAGGGTVVIDGAWSQLGGTSAMLGAAIFQPKVAIDDERVMGHRMWAPTATGAYMAAPTLPAVNIAGQAACDATHQMCSDATVVGSASWGSTVYACWAYVDIEGNEGPCSATTNWTSVASKAIDLGIPAASPGAVGAVPYLSLSGGTYILAYQIPVTSSVCTMTTLETITPACAVTNTAYGQVGSTFGAGGLFTTGGAQITTYPLSTAQSYTDLATTAQTLAGQHALTNSSVSYAYAPADRVGTCGYSSSNIVGLASASAISGSSATTVPQPIASWTIPAGCFNYIGAEFRVSGKFTYTDGGSGTSTILTVAYDANGTNVASVAKPLCEMKDTFTSVSGVDNGQYSCVVRILTTGATGTALVNGYSSANIAAGATTLLRSSVDDAVAASGTLALTQPARITVFFEAVGATSNPGAQGLAATLEVLN